MNILEKALKAVGDSLNTNTTRDQRQAAKKVAKNKGWKDKNKKKVRNRQP